MADQQIVNLQAFQARLAANTLTASDVSLLSDGISTVLAHYTDVGPASNAAPNDVASAGWFAPLYAIALGVGGSAEMPSPVFVSVTDFLGVDPTGATDSTAGIQAALNAAADHATLAFPPGTYLIATTPGLTVPNATRMWAIPGTAILKSTMAAAGAFPGNYIFSAFGTFVGAAGTVHTTPTVGSETISVALAVEPTVGQWIQVSHAESAAIYQVKAVAGAAGVWTVTTDRPIVFPFVATDVVQSLSAIVQDITIDGLDFQGTGDQMLEFAQAERVRITRCRYLSTAGLITSAVLGFDTGSRECTLSEFAFDLTGSAGSATGLYVQSNERTVISSGKVKNAALVGASILDSYACGLDDVWTYECARGHSLGRFSAGTLGSFECWVSGGSAVGCSSVGLDLNGSAGTWVGGGFSAMYGDGIGVTIEANTSVSDPMLVGVISQGNATGFNIGAGVTNACMVGCNADNSTANALSVASELDCTEFSANCNLAGLAVVSINFTSVTANACRFRGIKIVQAAASGYCLMQSGTGRIEIDGGTFDGACAVGLYNNAASVFSVRNIAIPAAAQGIFTAAGGTLRMGNDVNLTGCTTQLTGTGAKNRGTVAANGATPVAVAFPDLNANDRPVLMGTTASPTAWISALTPGTGFSLTAGVGDVQTYEYVID